MEFPIVDRLPLPMTCKKMVVEFLREPHPTAVLMKKLTFGRRESTQDPGQFWLTVQGDGVQFKDPDCNTLSDGAWVRALFPSRPGPVMVFKYKSATGEPLYPLDLDVLERDDSDLEV